MLKRLSVRNLAIVEKAGAEFSAGLTVITGETGAGKSVLMGALDLVLGGRADPGHVRDGATEAEVEALFVDASGAERLVRRTVTKEGRSRAWIDDESVSVTELRAFGHGLVDIHGPRANQKLLDEDYQRDVLDDYGNVDLRPWAEAYSRLTDVRKALAALREGPGVEDLDYLRFQANELDEADLSEEDESIAERHAAAAHAEEIVELANGITETLGGDRSAADLLASLRPKFAALARHLPAAEAWASEAEDLTVRIEELSRAVADAAAKIDLGEEDLSALDARLTVVNRLKRKYRVADVAELMAVRDEKKAKLELAEGRDEKIAALEREEAEALKDVLARGHALSKARAKAGVKLGKAISEELHGLGFLQAQFSVSLVSSDETVTHTGLDRVVFLFEPNPGETARPLASIASSGEIARVMLAVKVVTVGKAGTAQQALTLVFDEIDANIGGEVGKVVGEKMRAVAKGRQVIAITHLPQSAVYGERHLIVSKGVSGGRTRTRIEVAEGEDRVKEVARMLGGEKLTSVVRRHAEELLEMTKTEGSR